MIFIETIYERLLEETTHITTDDYSVDWLKQSRTYYGVNKNRSTEATIPVLTHLLKTLEMKRIAASNAAKQNNSARLLNVTEIYMTLSDAVADEIVQKSLSGIIKENDANVKDLLLQAADRMVQEEFKELEKI